MKRLAEPAGPDVVAVAGPNGAGKSTVGARLLEETLRVRQFVNADDIARGLSGFAPESAAFEAGRVMLHWMDELARRRETFAFETTLSGRGHARLLGGVAAAVVRRRYHRGLRNFRAIYRPLATTWKVYDNSAPGTCRAIATGRGPDAVEVLDDETWQRIEENSLS